MIVDFKSIQHDFYGKVEQPVLTLKTPDGRPITTVNNYYGLTLTFRFNDVSEATFSIPAFYEGVENKCYKEVTGMYLVEIEPFGDFVLVNPEVTNDGGRKEIKTCKAYSLEYAFNYKKIDLPAGTYNFYNPVDNKDTVIQAIVDTMPDWSIGEIDRELIGRWRTFENTDENLYPFMMNTLQESYNCLFLFDTFEKKINVMAASRSAYKLPIYLSYNNLLKSVEITELSDEVVTALSGYGSGDEVNIRSVNPNGTNTIYNLDYFLSRDALPGELSDKWTRYKDSLNLYQKIFSNLSVLYIQKTNEIALAKAKYSVLETERDACKTEYLTAQTEHGKDPEYDKEIEKLKLALEKQEAELTKQDDYIKTLEKDVKSIGEQRQDIVKLCAIKTYFTPDEIKVLTQYFKHDSIADDTFVIPEYSSSVLQSNSNTIEAKNLGNVKIVGAEVYASNIAEVFETNEFDKYVPYTIDPETGEKIYNTSDHELFNDVQLPDEIANTVADQLNNEAKCKTYEFRGGSLEFTYTEFIEKDGKQTKESVTLKGDVVNVNLHYNAENTPNYVDENSPDITKVGHYILTATLRNAVYRGTSYPSMNISMQGKILKNIPQISEQFVTFDIDTAVVYITAANTEYQKQAIIQELYDYVKDSLDKLSQPSYEFSVSSGNFLFAKEFKPFKDQLELGCTINLALDDNEDNIIQPILIEVKLNYDNESDFEVTFSNKYKSSRSEFQIADLITEMDRQTHSTTINKASYSAYKDSQAGTQVDNLTNNAIDIIRNKIINSNNQAIEWNSSGMFFRKSLPNGTFAPRQIGIINENIAFTKDGFKTLDIAIGAYKDPNLGEGYGIIAPSIFGTLIAGENLVIENKVESDTGDIVKQFKVDATGAWLHNSLLAFTKEPDPNTGYAGGKILIDPKYGIAAGNINLFTLKGTEVIPSFWDEENNKIIWDENEVIETEDGSVYYVPLNSQFFFDINTGNAYFAGTINGKNIVAETINGKAIKDGTLDAGSKLTGDISPDQMMKYILEAINDYAEIAKEGDNISLNLIGGLTNLNFEGGKITADTVDAKNITGDLIKAINLSAGTIDADKLKVSKSIVMSGEAGKLVIDSSYGIAAGNADLFTLDDKGDVIPSFLDENGNLIMDKETGGPLNSSFYFDIETGRTYFTGELSASQITSGKITSDYLEVKEGYITNAMIEDLSAGKIKGGQISADVMSSNVVAAINAHIGEATIDSAKIGDLSAKYMTTEEFVADHIVGGTAQFTKWLTGVNISGDVINAGTISAERLLIFDPESNKSVIWALNDGVLESQEGLSEEELKRLTLNGKLITAESITADKIAANSITSEKIKAGAIDADRLAANAVTGEKIAAGSITGDKIAAGSLTIGLLDPAVKQAIDDAETNASNAVDTVKGTVKSIINEYSLSSSATEYIPYPVGYVWNSHAPAHINGKYMWTRTKTTYVDLSIPPDYSDPVCIAGAKGESGSSNYIHIRYSPYPNGSNMVDTPDKNTKYMGVATTTSEIAPASHLEYKWSKYQGDNGTDSIILHITSSNGVLFKNNAVDTTLTVSIIVGDETITTSQQMYEKFGDKATITWQQKKYGQNEFEEIAQTDSRLSDHGFIMTLKAKDVDTRTIFNCSFNC